MNLGFGDWLIKKIGHYLTQDQPSKHSYLCDFDRIRYEVRPADVLLIEGRNHISHVIQQITQSPWSHSCLYIGRIHDIDDPELRNHIQKFYDGPSGDQLVIEGILGKGTIITPLSHYKNDHIRICRPAGLARADAQKVVAYAINKLGGEYNLRHLFDLARLMFPWAIMPRRWRSTLFEHNALKPTQDICSSMIADAFASVKFPILPIVQHDLEQGIELIQRSSKLFTPSDFDYSPYFNIIKYPFFAVGETSPYKDLPWRKGVVGLDTRKGIEVIKHVSPKSQPETKAESQPESQPETKAESKAGKHRKSESQKGTNNQ